MKTQVHFFNRHCEEADAFLPTKQSQFLKDEIAAPAKKIRRARNDESINLR
jgi:hypothetical protein